MDAERLLETAKDPRNWYSKSAALRRSADALWEAFFACTLDAATEIDESDSRWSEAMGYLDSAQLLYGLALETALKGYILEERPGDITFKIEADGTGKVRDVQVTQFGVSVGQGHDLEKLAGLVGLLDRTENPVFNHESDVHALQGILRFLTETIVWSGRYPVPLRSSKGQVMLSGVPRQAFAHYMRDWIDPVLDHYQNEHWQGPPKGNFNRLLEIAARLNEADNADIEGREPSDRLAP